MTSVKLCSLSWLVHGGVWVKGLSLELLRSQFVLKLTSNSLAYAEMRLLLAKMLWHFDFELENPDEDWYGSLKAFMVWERGSLKVHLMPRKL
jgi:hypothetical protein